MLRYYVDRFKLFFLYTHWFNIIIRIYVLWKAVIIPHDATLFLFIKTCTKICKSQ